MGITVTKVKADHWFFHCSCCGVTATYELKVEHQLVYFCETHLGQLNTKVVQAQARKV